MTKFESGEKGNREEGHEGRRWNRASLCTSRFSLCRPFPRTVQECGKKNRDWGMREEQDAEEAATAAPRRGRSLSPDCRIDPRRFSEEEPGPFPNLERLSSFLSFPSPPPRCPRSSRERCHEDGSQTERKQAGAEGPAARAVALLPSCQHRDLFRLQESGRRRTAGNDLGGKPRAASGIARSRDSCSTVNAACLLTLFGSRANSPSVRKVQCHSLTLHRSCVCRNLRSALVGTLSPKTECTKSAQPVGLVDFEKLPWLRV